MKPDHLQTQLVTRNDNIVLEVIRMILESIYEPCFLKKSFGFRQGLGTHDALEHIEFKFRSVDWIIEKDLQNTYSIIDNNILCNILSKKILDVRFLNLIRKYLKNHIFKQRKKTDPNHNHLVPQTNLISSIFTNIYYHELDQWFEQKAEKLNLKKQNHRNPTHKQFIDQISHLTNNLQSLDKKSKEYKQLLTTIKILKREQDQKHYLTKKYIQIEYVRYADDWMIGVKGDLILANQLKLEVSQFIYIHLKQTNQPIKTKITNLRRGKVSFLGYEIYLAKQKMTKISSRSDIQLTPLENPKLRFDIPFNFILKQMQKRGYIQILQKSYRPISKVSYTPLEDVVIVKYFSTVWLELSNYYSGCTNLSNLQYIHYLIHSSCAMTLGHRHRKSMKAIFVKHGKKLNISGSKITTSFPYRTNWSLTDRKWFNQKIFRDPFTIQ